MVQSTPTFDKLRRDWKPDLLPAIEELGNKQVSFGTAGIINTLVRCSNDPSHLKKNILLINGATIIRNVMNREINGRPITDRDIPRALTEDLTQLRTYFGMYTTSQAYIVYFFHPTIYQLIPEASRRVIIPNRKLNIDMVKFVSFTEKLPSNKLQLLGKDQWITDYGTEVRNSFSHQVVPRLLGAGLINNLTPRVILVSHCAIDYLMMDHFRNIELVDSHTGKITEKKRLNLKVWKTDEIPFNPTTLKLFGDSDYIQPLVKQRPAALKKLGNIRTKTELEIGRLAVERLGIDGKLLSWKL